MPNLYLHYDKRKLVFFWFLCCYRLVGKNIPHSKISRTLLSVGHFSLSRKLMVYYHEVLDEVNVSAERKRKTNLVEGENITFIWTFAMPYSEHFTNTNKGPFCLMVWQMKSYRIHRVNKTPKQWRWYRTN